MSAGHAMVDRQHALSCLEAGQRTIAEKPAGLAGIELDQPAGLGDREDGFLARRALGFCGRRAIGETGGAGEQEGPGRCGTGGAAKDPGWVGHRGHRRGLAWRGEGGAIVSRCPDAIALKGAVEVCLH